MPVYKKTISEAFTMIGMTWLGMVVTFAMSGVLCGSGGR